jgi:hypothetical protein
VPVREKKNEMALVTCGYLFFGGERRIYKV